MDGRHRIAACVAVLIEQKLPDALRLGGQQDLKIFHDDPASSARIWSKRIGDQGGAVVFAVRARNARGRKARTLVDVHQV